MVFVGSAKDSHWGSDLNFDFITVERSPFFVFSHSGITFPSCLVLLSFWKLRFLPGFCFLLVKQEAGSFSLLHPCSVQFRPDSQVSEDEECPVSTMLPPPCFTVGMDGVYWGMACVKLAPHRALGHLTQTNVSVLISSHQKKTSTL